MTEIPPAGVSAPQEPQRKNIFVEVWEEDRPLNKVILSDVIRCIVICFGTTLSSMALHLAPGLQERTKHIIELVHNTILRVLSHRVRWPPLHRDDDHPRPQVEGPHRGEAMIERVFDFCFGSQRVKYVVLLLAVSIAITATVSVRGLEAGPSSAPLIALLTAFLTIPIAVLAHVITADLRTLRLTHAMARFALRGDEDADAYLGDLDEYYEELRPRVGRVAANLWYLQQVVLLLLHISGRVLPLAAWVGMVVMILVVIDFTTGDNFLSSPFHVLHIVHEILLTALTLTMTLLCGVAYVSSGFERFRENKRKRASSSD